MGWQTGNERRLNIAICVASLVGPSYSGGGTSGRQASSAAGAEESAQHGGGREAGHQAKAKGGQAEREGSAPQRMLIPAN